MERKFKRKFNCFFSCEEWAGPSYYLLEVANTSQDCLACPAIAVCEGGADIFPRSNYWRSSNTTDEFDVWYSKDACLYVFNNH